jgi:class 3 adenylate cyclase
MAATARCPVLIRRDDQLATLEDALLEARRGRGRLLVVAGEAGIGKTRLTSELARQARRLDSEVLSGGCSEADLSLPYLPFVEAIGNYLAAQDLPELTDRLGTMAIELAQLFPQFGAPTTRSDPSQAKLRLFEAIVSLLAIPASDRGLLLVIEDVHWADDSSRELLDHIARRLSGMRALVVLTYRSDELHRRHPLLPTVRGWRRSDVATVLDLEPLPEAGVREMVAAITGTDGVEPELLALLHERTEGNPFFIEEMLSEAACRLEPGAPLTRATLQDVGIPETVRDTILQRLARLDPAHAEVLEVAAVLGRSFSYPTLLAVSEADAGVVQGALAAAAGLQLIEEHPDGGRYSWRHALTEESIHDEVVTPRRHAIHSRAADVLAADESTPAVDVANHLLWAGRFDEAVPICLRGAEEAENAVAFREAVALLERALPHISDPLEHARAVCRIGYDLALNGEPGLAQDFLADGIAELEALGEPVEAARYRIILGRCFWERAQPEPARAEYERARDVLAAEGPSAELAMAYVRLAGMHVFELDFAGCLEAARNAVEIAEAADAGFERTYALGFLGLGHLDAGEVERGFQILDDCYREARANGYWQIAQNVTWNDIWTRVHFAIGDLEPRLERFDAMPPVPIVAGAVASARSYVSKAHGDLRAAREDAERGIGLNDRLGYRKMSWRARVHLADVLAEMGRHDEARAVLPPSSERTELQDIVYDAAAQIRTRLAASEIDDATEFAREILDHAGEFGGHRAPFAVALEAFIAAGDLDSAEDLVERARSSPGDAGAAFMVEMDGRLALARGDLDRAITNLRAATAVTEREGYALMNLRDRVLLAEAVGRDGDREQARAVLGEVLTDAVGRDAGLIAEEARAAADRLDLELPDVEPEVAAADAPGEVVPAGERLVTSLFADVRGYTDLSAARAPADVADRLAALYRFATAIVQRHGGIVDKFAGDAVMASFNVSGRSTAHGVEALEAALTLRDKAALMELPLGIGIATGAAILGRGASADNVAVTGVATNLAARLQAAAGPGEILLSEEAHRRVEGWLADRGGSPLREELTLKGFDEPQAAYRLAAPAESALERSATA